MVPMLIGGSLNVLGYGLAALGPALGVAWIFAAVINGTARQPEARPAMLFSFILINNWFGELFVFMFPTFSHVGYVYGLAIVSWFVYVIAGFKTKGIRYLKDSVLPPGVPWYLRWLIIPLEFLSNFVTRPLTLSLRLFANMVAGHLIIMIFVVGGGFLLTYPSSIIYNVAGGLSLILSFALFALELFVGFLQAYVFTVLSAQYVASSMSEEH